MNKSVKIYGGLFLIIAILLAFLEVSKKEVTDWRKNFDIESKSPFGLEVFSKEVNFLLNKKVIKAEKSPYNYYSDSLKSVPHNILIIEKQLDKSSMEKIFKEVSKGSDALIFNEKFPKYLQDTLRFLTTVVNYEEENVLKLTDVKYKNDSIYLDKFPGSNGFYYLNKDHQILGKSDYYPYELQANFIKINFGKGHFYLHSEPVILSNYYLLKPDSRKYIEDVFSYLPNRKTVWFVDTESQESSSPLRFILANPPLKYAWYLFVFGLILFVLFNVKRKQRIVPIIEPLANKSVEFVKSIGNLYLQEGDTKDMMRKKSQYFLHKVRVDLRIDTTHLDQNFAEKLQTKTGKNLDKINEALSLIKKNQDEHSLVSTEDLSRLNSLLDEILSLH